MTTALLTGGFVAFVAAYAVAQYLANRKLEARVAWLVGQNGRIRTALREHGIRITDENEKPPRAVFADNVAAETENKPGKHRAKEDSTT